MTGTEVPLRKGQRFVTKGMPEGHYLEALEDATPYVDDFWQVSFSVHKPDSSSTVHRHPLAFKPQDIRII